MLENYGYFAVGSRFITIQFVLALAMACIC
jgi:hypothetical protein